MSHHFYEGKITHKRFAPKTHSFVYDFFYLDIDVDALLSLQCKHFALNRFGAMSFEARDHFGQSDDFAHNAHVLIQKLGWTKPASLRFITLPRIAGFVFNPISILLLLDASLKPTHLVAEVHNYNGGRVLYPLRLEALESGYYEGFHPKTMYVSPFLGFEGIYTFKLRYTPDTFEFLVTLSQEEKRMLIAHFLGKQRSFEPKTIRSLLCAHTFLTFFVVTRTLWQTFKLFTKSLTWSNPRPIDQQHKDLS